MLKKVSTTFSIHILIEFRKIQRFELRIFFSFCFYWVRHQRKRHVYEEGLLFFVIQTLISAIVSPLTGSVTSEIPSTIATTNRTPKCKGCKCKQANNSHFCLLSVFLDKFAVKTWVIIKWFLSTFSESLSVRRKSV